MFEVLCEHMLVTPPSVTIVQPEVTLSEPASEQSEGVFTLQGAFVFFCCCSFVAVVLFSSLSLSIVSVRKYLLLVYVLRRLCIYIYIYVCVCVCVCSL